MRLVITGGAGFLGSHLVEHYLKQGHRVVVLDNFKTGRRENLAPFKGNPRFEFKKLDVTKHINVSGSVDAVLHFASPASPVRRSYSGRVNRDGSLLGLRGEALTGGASSVAAQGARGRAVQKPRRLLRARRHALRQ